PRSSSPDGILPLDYSAGLLRRLASHPGVRGLPACDGGKDAIASTCGNVRSTSGRRNRRRARRLSLDPRDGELADCLATLAALFREEALRSAERIRLRQRRIPSQSLIVGN